MRQDRPHEEQRRLTARQASALMDAPGTDTLKGLRSTAIISLMLCTGICEAELAALDVEDLTQGLDSRLALHVRQGQGVQAAAHPLRRVGLGGPVVEEWPQAVGTSSGPVFCGFNKGNEKLQPSTISVRALQYVLVSYLIPINGQVVAVRPREPLTTWRKLGSHCWMSLRSFPVHYW